MGLRAGCHSKPFLKISLGFVAMIFHTAHWTFQMFGVLLKVSRIFVSYIGADDRGTYGRRRITVSMNQLPNSSDREDVNLLAVVVSS